MGKVCSLFMLELHESVYLYVGLCICCRGVLKVAEVASRFENVRNFITALSSLGFKMVSKVRQI